MLANLVPEDRSLRNLDGMSWPAGRHRREGKPSVRGLTDGLSIAGDELNTLANGTANAWTHVQRQLVVEEVRDRIVNPGLMHQEGTQFCGPMSIAFELAKRRPETYVRMCRELLEHGSCRTPTGRTIETTSKLRTRPVPPSPDQDRQRAHVDWLITASMRDDENWFVPIEDGSSGFSGLSTFGELKSWTEDVLFLNADSDTCFVEGEVDVMKMADEAVAAGGVAFLCIESNLIKKGKGREGMRYERHEIMGDGTERPSGSRRSAADVHLDHWVPLVSRLQVPSGGVDGIPFLEDFSEKPISFDVWSWGARYHVTGDVEGFGEYLYGAVVGS